MVKNIIVALLIAIISAGCTFGRIPDSVAKTAITTNNVHLRHIREQTKAHYISLLNKEKAEFYAAFANARATALARMELEDVLSADAVTELDTILAAKEKEFLVNVEAAIEKMNNVLSYYDNLILLNDEALASATKVELAYANAAKLISIEYAKAFEAAQLRAIERERVERLIEKAEALEGEEHEEFVENLEPNVDAVSDEVDIEVPLPSSDTPRGRL